MKEGKPFDISKQVVMTAFKRVKANKGSAGIDGLDIKDFEKDLKGNLYKIWNRMSSGSYFPPPVKLVEIPKKSGGTRGLGIPTVGDRVAQMVVKMYIEPRVEAIFHTDSYGYRPNKSAIDAIGQARKRCWRNDYVLEFDIKGLFDNIDHELLMRAVRKHISESWILMYIERWLNAPFINSEGQWIERKSGTPQGGVISPVLANLFMHYAFDLWMKRTNPNAPFERYADDAIIHCRTQAEAEEILEKLKKRLEECKLELHPTKTKIVYCKDKDRVKEFPVTDFEFLGYTFRRVFIKDRLGRLQFNFLPSVSVKSAKAFRDKIKAMRIHSYTGSKIEMIAEMLSPMVRGWLNYFTKFNPSAVKYTIDCLNRRLVKWAMCKYKRFRGHRSRAEKWLKELAKREPNMFPHWALGMKP
ncbi:group II intron reverse transcriptase/maturase [Paenibacillus donghaensis]|uniref:RNA-directed DNA polymerase n=1 Tax=Paenibacillus donghaensis TaxID=414771 RepID=A0A2Z2KPC6_9BACL|nr:group II intron reverse transcriptase/maturase [Paenibacillus donghaensis]ASA19461.1 group II intron reverse transcriptase/maturase [Paenibacillus donghaensis]ASA19508.1 group II intron reverse transcriptase/maturase [Paenibacillus donghaensis]ASA19818.1 group II intron reverse transcriptase/maturase [Paenibacillus donghaensis]ASA25543.1 group II intron reverse transcriptase/maturase [Paenibacillus donghaensis]